MSWRGRLLRIAGALIAGTLIGVMWVAWRGVQLYVHPPRRVPAQSPADYGLSYRDLTLNTADGLSLAAWYVPPRNGCVLLQAHGYGGCRDASVTARLARAGYGVLAWDFRAHGESGGTISTIGGLELYDAEAALTYVLAQPEVHCIGAWGESMGAVVLIRLAARYPQVQALISDSAFASLEDALRHAVHPPVLRFPMRLLAELVTGVRFRTVRPVADISKLAPRPVFIIHGAADTVTSPEAATQLYAAAGEPRTLWIVPSMEHIRARTALTEAYFTRVLAFLEEAFQP